MHWYSYRRSFYYYHYLLFLLVWYSIQIIQWYSFEPEKLDVILKSTVLDYMTACILCFFFVQIAKWTCQKDNAFLKVLILACVSVTFPSLFLILSNALKSLFGIELYILVTVQNLKVFTLRNMLVVVSVNGIFFWSYYRNRYQEQLDLSRKAESLAKDAQLLMLRYQINPHFLFNVLNSLHALVDENKEQAKALIIRMSEYYRSTIKNKDAKVTIREELDMVSQYFDIQQIRYGDQLRKTIEVDDDLLDRKIPCFIIHLLVENAVKYAIRDNNRMIPIDVRLQYEQGYLKIEVQNPGHLHASGNSTFKLQDGTKSGLQNICQRLELYYSDQAKFDLYEKDHKVIAAILIDQACL